MVTGGHKRQSEELYHNLPCIYNLPQSQLSPWKESPRLKIHYIFKPAWWHGSLIPRCNTTAHSSHSWLCGPLMLLLPPLFPTSLAFPIFSSLSFFSSLKTASPSYLPSQNQRHYLHKVRRKDLYILGKNHVAGKLAFCVKTPFAQYCVVPACLCGGMYAFSSHECTVSSEGF